ncbi:hypothetical protein [Methanosarcina lacustris]|nr:hypothetical protein [Methanosarcina lacustris]
MEKETVKSGKKMAKEAVKKVAKETVKNLYFSFFSVAFALA